MFQFSMTIIRDLYLYLTKVIFMLKVGKITSLYKLYDEAACRRGGKPLYDMLPHLFNDVNLPSVLT